MLQAADKQREDQKNSSSDKEKSSSFGLLKYVLLVLVLPAIMNHAALYQEERQLKPEGKHKSEPRTACYTWFTVHWVEFHIEYQSDDVTNEIFLIFQISIPDMNRKSTSKKLKFQI